MRDVNLLSLMSWPLRGGPEVDFKAIETVSYRIYYRLIAICIHTTIKIARTASSSPRRPPSYLYSLNSPLRYLLSLLRSTSSTSNSSSNRRSTSSSTSSFRSARPLTPPSPPRLNRKAPLYPPKHRRGEVAVGTAVVELLELAEEDEVVYAGRRSVRWST